MNETLLEKHENLVVEMGNVYLDNMELELGKKYKNHEHEVNAALSDDQYFELRTKYKVPNNEFYELYSEFQKMEPGSHLNSVIDAFAASGGSVDVAPVYDEETQRLMVSVSFVIKDRSLDNIEGLSPVEQNMLRMNAMLQVDAALSGSTSDRSPSF